MKEILKFSHFIKVSFPLVSVILSKCIDRRVTLFRKDLSMDGVLGVRHHEINFIISALIIEEQENNCQV